MAAIPAELLAVVREFCLAGKTGQIVLNVHQGAVKSAAITEQWRLQERLVPGGPAP